MILMGSVPASASHVIRLDPDVIGTAFFVTPWGAFLTAKHVVEEYVGDDILKVMLMYETPGGLLWLRPCGVEKLEHPMLDVAFGVAVTAGDVFAPQRLTLSSERADDGHPVSIFGYSHTRAPTPVNPRQSLEFWPAIHPGNVLKLRTQSDPGYRGWREYLVTAPALGCASGSPLLKRGTRTVVGVVSSAITDAVTFAVDLREFLGSWVLSALGGMTIVQYARRFPGPFRMR
jgi:hypothetical protein